MVAAQTHRGPDDHGMTALTVPRGTLVLGHRRLSIQDLSAAGHQPMENPETGDWIVFNGEIYNYPELRAELEQIGTQFRSRCDTEVILHAYGRWGTGAFDRLEGMFALGLFAVGEQKLILARDPLGIKPLYYTRTRGREAFAFASELRALEASGFVDREIDRRALASLLAYGAVPGPLTMLRDVRLLEPGTWASLDLTSDYDAPPRMTRYWDFPIPLQDADPGVARSREDVRSLLTTAVRTHLISDVPVGVFLSSGLDSTAMAVLAAEARQGDLDTFTIAREGDPESNEGPIAQDTARRLGARYHQIDLTDTEAQRLTENWLGSLDQPSVDGLNTYIISQRVRERGIVVALSGLGGDELFGGYSTFREVPRLARLARVASRVPRGVRRELVRFLYRGGTKSQRQKAMEMAGGDPSLEGIYFRRRRLLSDSELAALGLHAGELDLDKRFLPAESEPDRVSFRADPTASIGVLESRFYMGNMLLRDSDVFAMAHGLEIRVPLLDRRLADCVLSLPGALRVMKGGVNKPLLAEALGNRLPPGLLDLKKRGFSLPQARWMSGPMRPLFEDHLRTTRESGILDATGVDSVWRDFLDEPRGPTWSRAWTLGVLGAWLGRRSAPAKDGMILPQAR